MKNIKRLTVALTLACLGSSTLALADYTVSPRPYRQTFVNPVAHPEYINPATPEFPILACDALPAPKFMTHQRFMELREAGFNLAIIQSDDYSTLSSAIKEARGTYVRLILKDSETVTPLAMENMVANFKNDPTVAGYYLTNEPTADNFSEWRQVRDAIYKENPNTFIYANLLPVTSPDKLNTDSYTEYLKRFAETVDLPYISFDFNPLEENEGSVKVNDNFFTNLEDVANVCAEKNLSFWSFCQSAAYDNHPAAKRSYLLFEAFSALAYGAQGLQYPKYMTAAEDSVYRDTPIAKDGTRSKVWNVVKEVNREIQNLRKVFLGAKLKTVCHTGSALPEYTRFLTEMPSGFQELQGNETGLVVSTITNDGNEYVVLVNKDIKSRQKVKLKTSGNVIRMMPNGKEENFKKKSVTLEAGGYAIFKVS